MKKFFMLAAMSAALCFGAVACGDDDDDNGNGGNGGSNGGGSDSPGSVVASAALSDFGGVRLAKIDDIPFEYDSKGVLTRVGVNDDFFLFDYKKGTITLVEDDYKEVHNFTTDSEGRLTGIYLSYNDNGKLSYTFRYDGRGHLVYMEYNASSVEDGDSYEEKETVNYTWEGDLLTKCVVADVEKENGTIREEESSTFLYTYTGAPDNRFMQYTDALSSMMGIDSSIRLSMCAGLYGKGPVKYPTGIEVSGGWKWNDNIRYTLNSKGLVETETVTGSNNDTYTYRYTYE